MWGGLAAGHDAECVFLAILWPVHVLIQDLQPVLREVIYEHTGPKNLFFRARVPCQNNPFFGSVFLPKILGRGGALMFGQSERVVFAMSAGSESWRTCCHGHLRA